MTDETPPIVQAQLAAAQALEHRLTTIEEAIKNGFATQDARFKSVEIAVNGVDERVRVQNSRIGKLEEWRQKLETAQAFAKGVVEGRTSFTKSQLAVLAVVGPVVFAAIDAGIKLWA